MPAVNNVTLQITDGTTPTTRQVQVGYDLVFDAAEAGQTFRVAIELFGEDLASDDEPNPLPFIIPPQLVYTFHFGTFFFTYPYTTVTAIAGSQHFVETRQVQESVLNEDPGTTPITLPGGFHFQLPHPDELYAVVTVSKQAHSSTVHITV